MGQRYLTRDGRVATITKGDSKQRDGKGPLLWATVGDEGGWLYRPEDGVWERADARPNDDQAHWDIVADAPEQKAVIDWTKPIQFVTGHVAQLWDGAHDGSPVPEGMRVIGVPSGLGGFSEYGGEDLQRLCWPRKLGGTVYQVAVDGDGKAMDGTQIVRNRKGLTLPLYEGQKVRFKNGDRGVVRSKQLGDIVLVSHEQEGCDWWHRVSDGRYDSMEAQPDFEQHIEADDND